MATNESHAHRFERTREAHRTELAQDYVEVILDLIDEQGEARMTEVAGRLGVAHPTVAKALRRLQTDGLVDLKPYRAIKLTEEGELLARKCRARHQTVAAFLVALGLDEATAEAEAEGIEHHVGQKTLTLMSEFAKASKP
ncbi:MAG: manganese-binding transcriptional regulator MntR [Fimbriimonadaceae bacterium]|nr:MAG: manganese-binding transcriptional regulator MntR [Fimbriimonadaceae bacterium]